MRWIGWLLRSKDRRLEISRGGKWFLAFTVVLGVVAINSGNNVIYLLESLLLSALIFSGVLSELTLSRLTVARWTGQAVEGYRTRDSLLVRNRGWLPLYCVEIGEWREERFEPLQFVLQIPGRSDLRLRSEQVLPERGRHHWEALALATSFPFGFARKIRIIAAPGARVVWPAGIPTGGSAGDSGRGQWENAEGELEELDPWEDVSRVHWPSALRSGKLMIRPRRRQSEDELVVLELGRENAERERRIRGASYRLQKEARSLLIRDEGTVTRVDGRRRSLDALALLPKDEK
jgi:uncharacterized protein (DUF58 family)